MALSNPPGKFMKAVSESEGSCASKTHLLRTLGVLCGSLLDTVCSIVNRLKATVNMKL